MYVGFDLQHGKLMALSQQNLDRLNVGFVECEKATRLCSLFGVSDPTLLFFPAMKSIQEFKSLLYWREYSLFLRTQQGPYK